MADLDCPGNGLSQSFQRGVDPQVLVQILSARAVVRVDQSDLRRFGFRIGLVQFRALRHEALRRPRANGSDNPVRSLPGPAIPGSDHGRPADSPAPGQSLAPTPAHAATLAAHVGLASLHRACEQRAAPRQRIAHSAGEKPCAPPRIPPIPVQLHARDAPEVRGRREHGSQPDLTAELRPLHDGTGPGAEASSPAGPPPASVRHRVPAAGPDVPGAAGRTANPMRPAPLYEPRLGLRVRRMPLDELHESKAPAMIPPRCLGHAVNT